MLQKKIEPAEEQAAGLGSRILNKFMRCLIIGSSASIVIGLVGLPIRWNFDKPHLFDAGGKVILVESDGREYVPGERTQLSLRRSVSAWYSRQKPGVRYDSVVQATYSKDAVFWSLD